MKKSFFVSAVFALAILSLLFCPQIYAGKKAPDIIKMENKKYKKHRYPIIKFTHKKHIEDYKAKCGDCHHDNKGKPLNNIKLTDNVQSCMDCHSIPSRKPKGERLSGKQKLKYHAEALHKNCKDCHKTFNKKNKGKPGFKKAPVTCKKCHRK